MMEEAIEMIVFLGSLWVTFVFGLIIGWSWKPRWVASKSGKLTTCVTNFLDSSLPPPPLKTFTTSSRLNSFILRSSNCEPYAVDNPADKHNYPPSITSTEYDDCSSLQLNENQSNVAGLVTEEDLGHLYQLVEIKDRGPAWIHMMDRSTPGMSFQAWRRDPKAGPIQYRSRTVFEDAAPEMVRDFFWDDDFRPKWDKMLIHSAILDVCPTTGTMVVHWTRKFPFFCSDREYIIGRRIWESGSSYYCVTKGVPYPSIPRREKPRRVDVYYSSFCVRAVEPRTGDSQLPACEVIFFHHEDMGIPREIAKLGVRQGMWGTVKKMEPGIRAYQKERASGTTLSRPAFIAQINTRISPEYLRSLLGRGNSPETEAEDAVSDEALGRNIPKILIIGGAIILACSLIEGSWPKHLYLVWEEDLEIQEGNCSSGSKNKITSIFYTVSTLFQRCSVIRAPSIVSAERTQILDSCITWMVLLYSSVCISEQLALLLCSPKSCQPPSFGITSFMVKCTSCLSSPFVCQCQVFVDPVYC